MIFNHIKTMFFAFPDNAFKCSPTIRVSIELKEKTKIEISK